MNSKKITVNEEFRWSLSKYASLQEEADHIAEMEKQVRDKQISIKKEISKYLKTLHPADFVKNPTLWQRIHRRFTRGR